jgi:hypothetical protein
MSDDILTNAIARRDAALAEARRWADFIRMYGEITGTRPGAPADFAPSARAASAPGALSETEKATAAILSELGRPVPTRELLELLAARGVKVGGQDPASTLSARLSRAPSLENIRQRGWWIKGRADDNNLRGDTSSALFINPGEAPAASPSAPVEPGEEVAHDNMTDDDLV